MKVPYINKKTTAGTQYRQTTKQDLNRVLEQCKTLVQVAPYDPALQTPSAKMPRMSNGKRNTPETMCQGVIDNFNSGQYDLSDKQCDGLTEAFRIGEQIIEDFETVEFEEVTSLPKIRPTATPAPVDDVFGSLFDIDSITVTYKRKM